jgi:hypothetical protein
MSKQNSELFRFVRVPGFVYGIFAFAVLCLASLTLIWRGDVLLAESASRMALGGMAVLFAPGLALGIWAGVRCYSIFETVAMSFLFSIILDVAAIPILFFFSWTARAAAVSLLLFSTASFLSWLVWHCRSGHVGAPPRFLLWTSGRWKCAWWDLALFVFLLGLGCLAYRWGEDLFDMGNEKLLHLMYARQYFSLTFIFREMGLAKGMPPPNLVNLWEYLLALWARAANMDILPVFVRARCLSPIVGLSCMFVLARLVFADMKKTRSIFFVFIWFTSTMFFLIPTSGLDWVQASDFTRGVFNFFGTVHHADPAMDILLPLGMVVCLRFFHSASRLNGLILAGFLVICVLWHPREFFQTGLSFGVFGLVMLLVSRSRRKIFLRLLMELAIFLAVGIAFSLSTSLLVDKKENSYDELAIKRAALEQAFDWENLTGVRNPFKFPFHYRLSSIDDPARIYNSGEMREQIETQSHNHYYWLLLTAVGLPIIAFLGGRREKILALFTIMLWLLTLSWNTSMLLITATSYSEFFMSTPRLLYLCSWFVIGSAICLISTWALHTANSSQKIVRCGGVIAVCLFFGLVWWRRLGLTLLESILGAVVYLLAAFLLFLLISRRGERQQRGTVTFRLPCLALGLIIVLSLGWMDAPQIMSRLAFSRSAEKWFEDGNQFQYSEGLIRFLRSIPAKGVFFADPRANSPFFVYAPHYVSVFPAASVMAHMNDFKEIQNGRHPLLGPGGGTQKDQDILEWFSTRRVNYILLQKDNYVRCSPLLMRRPDLYQVLFENKDREEIVFALRTNNS